jgi:sugar O-acyltransferase (sialic acid O-acetyltransferase NeuD family)
MQKLIILGAGPHAQEMAEIVGQINRQAAGAPVWNLLGFLVPETQLSLVGQPMGSGLRVLDTYAGLGDDPDASFALEYNCAAPEIGSHLLPRERVVSLVAPGAFVASTSKMGTGCVIYPGCFVGHNAVLGDRVFALAGAVINHDDVLEDGVTVCSNASLAGSVHVEADCYLGQACTIRQCLRIGQGSVIGMGAVVVKDVRAGSVMVGNPARRMEKKG